MKVNVVIRNRSLTAGRRKFLKYAMTGAVGTSLTIGTTAASSTEQHYSTRVNIVEAGADNTGKESITPILEEHRASDTLFEFPDGEYYMDRQFRFTNFSNVGFVGENATIIPANYHNFDGPQYRLFRMGTADRPGEQLEFRGFEIDQTASETGIRVLNAEVTDGLLVEDVHIRGLHDSGTWGPGLFNIIDPQGTGIVRRFAAPDGGLHVDDTPNSGNMWRGPTGILTNVHHQGSLTYHDCELGGFPDNGLYCSGGSGNISIKGGSFSNSATASVRIGGYRARIEDAEIRVDQPRNRGTHQHGIRLDYCEWTTIEDVSIRLPEPNGYAIRVKNDVNGVSMRRGDILVGPRVNTGIRIDPETGPVYINGTDIEFNGGGNAVQIRGTDAGRVGMQNVSITGDASGSPMYHAIYTSRNNCRFRDLSIDQQGDSNRRGIELNGSDYIVYNCDITASDYPIQINGNEAWIEDCHCTSTDGSASINLSSFAGSDIRLKNNEFPDGVRDSR